MTDCEQFKELENRIQELEKREKIYHDLFHELPIGLYITKPDGTLVDANPELIEILGFKDLDSLKKRNVADGYKNKKQREEWICQIIEKGKLINHEEEWIKANGETIIVSESTRVIKNNSDEIIYFKGSVVDITSKKKLEKITTCMENMEFQKELVAGLYHYTISKITGIKCWFDMITKDNYQNNKINNQQNAQLIQSCRKSINDLINFINEFLFDQTSNDVDLISCDIYTILDQSLAKYKDSLEMGILVRNNTEKKNIM